MRMRQAGAVVWAVLGGLCAQVGGQPVSVQRPRALLLNHDPILENRQNKRLHTYAGWNDAAANTTGYVNDLAASSHGLVLYRVTRTIYDDEYPIKADGFRYTDETYVQCLSTWSGWHQPDGVDYKAICRDYDLARKVDSGELDEILMHGAPYFGYWESTMAGRGGYWCNSGPQTRIACSKIFVIMGFNYERGIGEMLEDYGHRTESILWRVYGSWSADPTHAWNRFTLYDKIAPGEAACGNVHFAPNSQSDYDWGNRTYVWSTCDDWLNNYPNLTGQKKWVNCSEWGNGDIRLHHRWWLAHIPHVAGSTTEYGMTRLNNWWEYMQNFNRYAESGGDHVPGGTAPPAVPHPGSPVRLTNTAGDDWNPQTNASGRVVWQGWDGADFEIYAAGPGGANPVRITNNSYSDESPRINAAGKVVWQAFDGQDYEIFTANADGTGLVRVTDNAVDDWHPAINDAGRIVWDAFDGQDYEIWSANADGTGLVRITNNAAGSGYPREDVWPQINAAGRVVWFGYDGNDWEIFSANADGTGLVNVSNNTFEDEYPQINDAGRVVWHGWPSAWDHTNAEIYSANATGGAVTRLTNNSVEDWWPQIGSDGQVVWMRRTGGDWEVMRAAATGGAATALTNNSSHDQYPQVDGAGRVAWQGFDGQDWEIYVLDGGQIWQLTNNEYDDKWPALRNGIVTWHAEAYEGSSGRTTEIFALDVAGSTPPVAADVTVTVPVNVPAEVPLEAASPGGRPLTFVIVSLPAHGGLRDPAGGLIGTVPYTLAGGGSVVRYRPAKDYAGPDSFQFRANDGLDSNTATVWITVGGPERLYSFPLDVSPGWTMQGQWAFGIPLGLGGQNGHPDPTSGRTGSYVLGYNLGGDYAPNMIEYHLTTGAMDCRGASQVRLRFWRWLGVEQSPYDHAYVRVSRNGTAWTTVWENTTAVTDGEWTHQDLDISGVADDQPTVYVRWTMGTTDSTRQYCGWNIDDVEIWGVRPHAAVEADLDWDGDVDVSDFGVFQACFNGANTPPAGADCGLADFDGDGDVDLNDFSRFQACFNGPGRPGACGDP